MTYKDHLDTLAKNATQKSNAYIAGSSIIGSDVDSNQLFNEWEDAEYMYSNFMDYIKQHQIPGNTMMLN